MNKLRTEINWGRSKLGTELELNKNGHEVGLYELGLELKLIGDGD